MDSDDDRMPDAEFATWHVFDAGDLVLRLKVRYIEGVEVPNWRDGPGVDESLRRAALEGWYVFDRESGGAPGEHAIFHLKRVIPPASSDGRDRLSCPR